MSELEDRLEGTVWHEVLRYISMANVKELCVRRFNSELESQKKEKTYIAEAVF